MYQTCKNEIPKSNQISGLEFPILFRLISTGFSQKANPFINHSLAAAIRVIKGPHPYCTPNAKVADSAIHFTSEKGKSITSNLPSANSSSSQSINPESTALTKIYVNFKQQLSQFKTSHFFTVTAPRFAKRTGSQWNSSTLAAVPAGGNIMLIYVSADRVAAFCRRLSGDGGIHWWRNVFLRAPHCESIESLLPE